MATEARLHEILDVYEQALSEGDQATADAALALYNTESNAPSTAVESTPATTPAPMTGRAADALAPIEVALQAVTGLAGTVGGGLAGIAGTLLPGEEGQGARWVEGVQDAMTYQPRTEYAQDIAATAAKPFEAVHEYADTTGNLLKAFGGPDWLATGARSTIEGAAALAGGGELPKLGAVKNVRAMSTNPKVNLLLDEGVPVNRAQRGSKRMQDMARAADDILGESSGAAKQREAFNAALLRRAGWKGDKLTGDVLSDLRTDIGRAYDDLHARVPTKLDGQFHQELQALKAEAVIDLDPMQLKRIENQIDNILDKGQTGSIAGEPAQNIRTKLGTLSQVQDPFVQQYAARLNKMLDDAFERGADPADAAKMVETRARYRVLRQLEDAMQGNASGDVSVKKLYQIADRPKNRSSRIHDLANAGRDLLPDTLGNSGTTARAANIGKVASLVSPDRWWDAARIVGAIAGGRLLNESPNLGAKAGAVAANPAVQGAAIAGSGEAMLAEQQRLIDEYLQALAAR